MINKKIIIYLAGIYIFWLCLLPVVVSKTAVLLCDNLSHNSPYTIKITNPKTTLSILPVATIYADEIDVSAKNNSIHIKSENFKLQLRLLPLLSGNFHINNIKMNSLQIKAILDNAPELDKDFFNKIEKTKLKCNSTEIADYNIELYPADTNMPVILSGKDFDFKRKNRYIKLKTNSHTKVGNNNSEMNVNLYLPKNNDINKTIFDIQVTNLDIAPFRTYLKHYLPKDLQELRGCINIHADKKDLITELSDFSFVMKDSAKTMLFPKKMSIKSKFSISQKQINFENIDITSPRINVHMNGKLLNYFGTTMPTVNFNIRIDKSSVEDFISMLPAFKVEEIDVYKLKKYKFYGDAMANLSVKGRLPEPDVYGDIYINNGILIKPIPNTSKGATIKLHLTGKHANFDVRVPAGGMEKVWVVGTQELYNIKYADMIVKSSETVDLKVAQEVVEPLHEILNFIIGPVPIMDIHGKGNIDIRVKGNRKNPHVWGIFNVKQGTVKFEEIPNLILTKADAALKFNDQKAVFTSTNGLVNNQVFSINGTCDLFGKFDFDVISNNQPTKDIHYAILTSTMIPDIQKMIPKADSISGTMNLSLKVFGAVKDIADLKFNENAFVKGNVILEDNTFVIQNIKIEKTHCKLFLDSNSADADITAVTANQPLSIRAKTKNDIADIVLNIPRMNPNFLITQAELSDKQYLPYIALRGKYHGNINEPELDKLDINAKILDSNPAAEFQFMPSGTVNISKNRISIKNIKGYMFNDKNTFDIDITITSPFSSKFDTNGYIKLKTPDISSLNAFMTIDFLPNNIKNIIKKYEFCTGALNLNAKIANNKINMDTDLSGISFLYEPLDMPIEIVNGNISIKNNNLKLNKINLLADKMPILIDGDIKDLLTKQNFNLYFNSKPKQEFIDKYINKNQIYPIKIKGDIVYWLRLKGTPENYDIKGKMNMNKDSSVYHFGATIGDIENAIEVSVDTKVFENNTYKIKEFSYDKIVDSQSGRQTHLNMLKAWGGVKILPDNLIFDNLRIKTTNPTDARIFNIIFRKPNLKQGQFTSDLKINGQLSDAKVLGNFHIFEANLPFLDTTMKNIELVFKDNIIEIKSKGEIIGNEITLDGIIKNKLTLPYHIEKANLYAKDLDLNQIINKLKVAEAENTSTVESFENLSLKSLIANDFRLTADSIRLRNIYATNFEAVSSLSDKGVFDVNKFKFNIANGHLEGKYTYNFVNKETGINLVADNISANDITLALFDLDNQIYGDLTGKIVLNCNGTNYEKCMQTLNGTTNFNVQNGKMPKLGSLEYLLKAGNLVKGGLTGLSINSVIDLITPLKTGEFSDIYGLIKIKDGIAEDIEITTKGKDLSLFIDGTYNFSTSNADMEVLGLLSRKISTMFGPIGNMSINTLFNVIPGFDLTKESPLIERINKIPGIELSNKTYRKFVAEIKGNIKGDEYVKSFRWIN